jgi:hypothetical protein
VLSEWIICGAPCAANLELDDETIALMEQQLRRLPLPDYPFWPDGGPVRWFERSGAILREDPGTWLWAGATSPDDIAAVRCALPGGWSSDEDQGQPGLPRHDRMHSARPFRVASPAGRSLDVAVRQPPTSAIGGR